MEDKDDEKKPLHDEGIRLKKPDGTIGISGNGLSGEVPPSIQECTLTKINSYSYRAR